MQALLLSSLPPDGWNELDQVVGVGEVSALQGGGPPPVDGTGPGYTVKGSMLNADFSTSNEVDLDFEAIERQGFDQTEDSVGQTAGRFGGLFMEVAADVADSDSNNRRLSAEDTQSPVEVKEQLRVLRGKLHSARHQALVVEADLAVARARSSATQTTVRGSRFRALAEHEKEQLQQSAATANRLQASINKVLSSSDRMVSGLQKLPPRPRSLLVVRRGPE